MCKESGKKWSAQIHRLEELQRWRSLNVEWLYLCLSCLKKRKGKIQNDLEVLRSAGSRILAQAKLRHVPKEGPMR